MEKSCWNRMFNSVKKLTLWEERGPSKNRTQYHAVPFKAGKINDNIQLKN